MVLSSCSACYVSCGVRSRAGLVVGRTGAVAVDPVVLVRVERIRARCIVDPVTSISGYDRAAKEHLNDAVRVDAVFGIVGDGRIVDRNQKRSLSCLDPGADTHEIVAGSSVGDGYLSGAGI